MRQDANWTKQDKKEEMSFFQQYAEIQKYDVFTQKSNLEIIRQCLALSCLEPGARVVDLGCGSGVFTRLLDDLNLNCSGLDISYEMMARGRESNPNLGFVSGDIESLPYRSESLDGIILSGVLHHLPDPMPCAQEVFRVLKPNGVFVAFDPNRLNPFMWLYRDWSSPLYSRVGVTQNERPLTETEITPVFTEAGFSVSTHYVSGLQFDHVASSRLRWTLSIYHFLDQILFRNEWSKPFRAFLFTSGLKN